MADDLYTEGGDDGNLWILSRQFGTAIAVCKEVGGEWFAAEDDSFSDQIGPFPSVNDMLDHVEQNKSFGPWGSPAN